MPNNLKVYFYTKPVDMRKGINGLSLFVADRLELDPLSGHLYLFANRGANRIKALYWQKNYFFHKQRLMIYRSVPHYKNKKIFT